MFIIGFGQIDNLSYSMKKWPVKKYQRYARLHALSCRDTRLCTLFTATLALEKVYAVIIFRTNT